MISLKRDYERDVSFVKGQVLSYQHNKHLVQMHMPSTSQCCQGLSSFSIIVDSFNVLSENPKKCNHF